MTKGFTGRLSSGSAPAEKQPAATTWEYQGVRLFRDDVVGAGSFLALAHFKLDSLTVVESGKTAAALDF